MAPMVVIRSSMRRLLLAMVLPIAFAGCAQQLAQGGPACDTTAIAGVGDSATQVANTTNVHWQLPDVEAAICEPPRNLWARIRAGMTLPDHHHPGVQADLEWYSHHQGYLDRVVERATPYLYLVVQAVEERNMPTEIALLPVVESAYQPFAYSHGRAAGLWQFIPGTGRRFDLKQSWWYDGRRDVTASTRAALDYLEYLHDQFHGDWLLALAAYNSGEGTVQHAIAHNRRLGKPTDFWSLDLPAETRGYVPKLLAISDVIEDPQKYDLTLAPIPNRPYLAEVKLGSQIDLALAARLAGVSIEDIYRYNPAFNRWATDPNGPHHLLLPVDKIDQFEARLAELPPSKRIQWKRHKVKPGENLLTLAKDYHTTVEMLRRVNGLHGNIIRAGHTLTIPIASRNFGSYRLSAEQRRITTQNQPHGGRKIVYEVRSGDTMWDIAREHHVSVQALAKWNAMAPRDPLTPGKHIVIWVKSSDQLSMVNPAHFVYPIDNSRRRIGYTVHDGDSLALIAQRFRVTVDNLIRWNRLHNGRLLHPGQRLTLYVDVTKQSGNI